MERQGITIQSVSFFLVSCVMAAEPSTAADILTHLKRFISEYSDDDIDGKRLDGWTELYYDSLVRSAGQVSKAAVECANQLIQFGHILRPCDWDYPDLNQVAFLLEIYLITGGNPNEIGPSGECLIIFALNLITFALRIDSDTLDARQELSVRLLASLIRAGAFFEDIVMFRDCYDCIGTLDFMAFKLGIWDIWNDALKVCGLHSGAVSRESHRMSVIFRRLRGATRTSVDEVDIIGDLDCSGLRRRNIRGRHRDDAEE